ncbi:MAG TPA: cell division protein SepF [Candidatus Bathyarchaeia archaeon]|nr:cell division protein SepF [Candidatus Bathyarchaeia archaeon]
MGEGRIMINSFPVENEVQQTSLSLSKAMLRSSDGDSERFPLANPSIQQSLYLKAYSLQGLADLPKIKAEIIEGNILIVKITPIAKRSEQETKSAIKELVDFVDSIQGDIARLEEERIVLTPPTAKIWRDKTSNPTISMHAELNE